MRIHLHFEKNDGIMTVGEATQKIVIDFAGDPGIVEEVKEIVRRHLIQVKKGWMEY